MYRSLDNTSVQLATTGGSTVCDRRFCALTKYVIRLRAHPMSSRKHCLCNLVVSKLSVFEWSVFKFGHTVKPIVLRPCPQGRARARPGPARPWGTSEPGLKIVGLVSKRLVLLLTQLKTTMQKSIFLRLPSNAQNVFELEDI